MKTSRGTERPPGGRLNRLDEASQMAYSDSQDSVNTTTSTVRMLAGALIRIGRSINCQANLKPLLRGLD